MRNLIRKAPLWIKKPIKYVYGLIPYEKRMGKVFWDTYNFLQESQWWSKEQLEEYQMRQLEKLMKHAYETIPYYKKLFNETGITPKDIQNFSDLKKIPYLTKQIIQDNPKDLISNKYKKNDLRYVTTGGTTGIPMGFYQDNNTTEAIEWAFMTNQWSRVGYNIYKKNKNIILRGNIPCNGIYEYNGPNLILSSYHLTENNILKYIKMSENFQPDFIQAYPSSIGIISDFLLHNNIKLKLDNLKAILCGSENIYNFQRKKIEKIFKKRVYSWYGHTEKCCLAGECEKSNYYHLQSEYGYTEIINKNGRDVTSDDEIGEIVATGFNNYSTPFIRYKTGDLAINTNGTCRCGRNYKLIKRVEGRKQDLLITSKGYYIIADMVIGSTHDDIFDNVAQLQFYQEKPGTCEFRIIKKNSYTQEDEKYIYSELKKKLGADIQLKIKYVNEIPRTKSGKYRFLIQKLDLEVYAD